MRLRQLSILALALTAISASAGTRAWATHYAGGWWALNETTTADPAAEGTGNIPDGTYGAGVILNQPSAFPGLGTAARFTGAANSEVNVGGGTFFTATSNFSTSAWVNFDNFAGKHTYLGSNRWGVRNDAATPHITTFGVKDYLGTPNTFVAGQWHHVVTVLDSNFDVQFYVDGQFAGSDTHNAGSNGSTNPFVIGAVGPGGGERMQGLVDDVGVFQVALTAAEAGAIYSLAAEPDLGYDLGLVTLMLEAFDEGDDSVTINGTVWQSVTGLAGPEGQVQNLGDGGFEINLGGGNGFAVQAVPEPASIAAWSLLGLAGVGYLWRRGQKKSKRD
jgi:hypothetical protein